ncbi:ATP-binding protein [Pseudomonas serboccidentalis]|uniref:ATP-binding protein n=1 Tax=Pseudomonas serboccidentalis TaxID=2964670 RepID=UPI0039E0FB06
MPRFSFILWSLLIVSSSAHSTTGETLKLLSHALPHSEEPKLSEEDWRWLRWRRELVLGTALPDNPPLEMSNGTHDYEGITADYISTIVNSLGIAVRVRRYADHLTLIDALNKGEVDLISSAELPENHAELLLSENYASNRPTLISRIGEAPPLADKLRGQRLAIRQDSISQDEVQRLYPQAVIKTYPSEESAVAAVAYGQADVSLGEALSAQFLISNTYSNYVQIVHMSESTSSGFSFALRKDNARLQNILNVALNAIPKAQTQSILRRWGDKLLLSLEKTELTSTERLWIKQHPTVTIAINGNLAPLSYFDANGNYLGVTSELLSIITAKTGLQFKLKSLPSEKEKYEALQRNEAQTAADSLQTPERSASLFFTRPYMFSPFVIITQNKPAQPQSLEDMSGKTLSLTTDHPLIPFFREKFPKIKLLEVRSNAEGLALTKDGESDATLQSAMLANYNLPRIEEDQLKVAFNIGSQLATAAFSTRRDEIELHSILEKTLRSIPPDAIKELNSRWRTNTEIAPPSWYDYRDIIYPVIAGSATLLLIALAWGAYLRSQIKQRKQAKRALSNQIRLMDALINGTPHPIYVRGLDRRLLICNDSYLQALNAKRESLIGKTIAESGVEEAASIDAAYQNILAGGEPLLRDREVHINGQRLRIYHWLLPFYDDNGDVQGIIGGWLDISERELLLEELRQAKEDAVDANHAKTTFLATMSHEIRTPMSAVIGMLELTLKRADQGQLDRPSIEVAYRSARGLLDLIGDILDIARIESGHLSLSPERANLRELMESVIRVFDGLARQKGLRLLLEIDNNANCDVLVDPLRFKQVLSNLISNAIKFTAQGSVQVSLLAQPVDDEKLQVTLSIKDEGIGISPEDQQRLFQPFSQVGDNGQQARSGTGLGLVISRTLCEMMGGQLTLESQPGVGTCINIQLLLNRLEPLSMPTPLAISPSEPVQKSSLHVLVVDDNQANRQLLCEQLKYLNHSMTQAEDGAEGLQAWQQEVFDVVITDCNMPVMSGYDLARQIRQIEQEEGRAHTPVFGFTANVQQEEHQRCERAGMDGCIFKPIELSALERHLNLISPLPKPAKQSATLKSFDANELDHLTGGDPQVIQRVLQGLLESNQQDLAQLRRVLSSDNSRGVLELAHRVKGAARIIKARTLIGHCEQLEQMCRQSTGFIEIKAVLINLEQSMVELEGELLSQKT